MYPIYVLSRADKLNCPLTFKENIHRPQEPPEAHEYLGTDHYFFNEGVTIFGTCRQFFLKNNAFQTIFFITFCYENNFFTTILKNVTGFFIDLI